MKLIIDDAHIDAIRHIYEYYPVSGVTTNPTILAHAGKPPFETLHAIRDLIGPGTDLHVQTVAADAEGMLRDANRILDELGGGTYIKIPCVPEGFKAMKKLHASGVRLTGTAVYTPMQAYLAGECGADYVAPYINRIDNMGFDGIRVAKRIHDIFINNGMHTQVLAASFKNSLQVLELCVYGVGACTVAPEFIEKLVGDPAISAAVADFTSDFEALAGAHKTMADCL